VLFGACPHYGQRKQDTNKKKAIIHKLQLSEVGIYLSGLWVCLPAEKKNKKRDIYLFTFYSTAVTFG